jgi:hypothetical protein
MTVRNLLFRSSTSVWLLTAAGPAAHAQVPGSELVTRMVKVEGHAMRVRTAGLESRRPGEPVVVFENGGLSSLDSWSMVLPRVAGFAPVVAYEHLARFGDHAEDQTF